MARTAKVGVDIYEGGILILEGASELDFEGAGVTIGASGNRITATINGGGSGGGGSIIEITSGIIDDSNTAFVFASEPNIVVVNGESYQVGHGWSWNSGTSTVTLDNPVGTGGDIYGILL